MKLTRPALLGEMLLVAALVGACGARSSLSTPPAEKDPGDPCDGISCDTPPEPGCRTETTLRSFTSPGICIGGACSYPHVDTVCPVGCEAAKCKEPKGGVMVSAGSFFTCAVNSAGAAKCWGSNASGMLGNTSVSNTGVPVDVLGLSSAVLAVTAGGRHACAITTAGAVKCWGSDDSNQLANGNMGGGATAVAIPGLSSGVVAISAGDSETCAITTTGEVKCWGGNPCGYAMPYPPPDADAGIPPVDIPGLMSGVAAISLGRTHTCVIPAGGAVKCCGTNQFGEVGTNSTTDSPSPASVIGFSSGARAVAAGFSASCAVDSAGTVSCWGSNLHGQLGNSLPGDSLTPVEVQGASSVVAVTIGLNHACVLTAEGGVKCWGWNFYGQLGNHSTADSFFPVDVEGLTSDVVSVSAGATHTCAVTKKGAVKCWGSNLAGELGNDSLVSSDVPVDVIGL